jgi:hypothetical protein
MAQIVLAAFGLMFLLDATDKALHAQRFRDTLSAYELLPAGLTGGVALLIAITEFVTGAALLGRYAVPPAALVGAFLLSLFATAMAVNLGRGRTDLECGCGTAARGQRLQWRLVARNAALAAALLGTALTTEVAARLSVLEVLPAAFGLALVYLALSAVWASGSEQKWRLGSM